MPRGRELKARGMRPSDIAKALKIGRAAVYRVLESRPLTGASDAVERSGTRVHYY
jgi:hypothetical protein